MTCAGAGEYWNHNVAYHAWVLRRVRAGDAVLDVGCGDGLLAARLAARGVRVVGVEPYAPAAQAARARLAGCENAAVRVASFEAFAAAQPPSAFDVIIFVASLHHLDANLALDEAKRLLAPSGKILIVGLAKPAGALDYLIEALRLLPAKLGSALHGEVPSEARGLPTAKATLSYKHIRHLLHRRLPHVRIRRALYFRYLASWTKLAE